jgi:predicted amidohydrolase YtcJ
MKTLLYNARVRTGKKQFAEAVGFDNESGKILFAGSNHEADKIKTDYDELTDIKGKLVIPAFTDGHCHLVKASLVNRELNLRNAATRADFTIGLSSYAAANNAGWITGGYFSDSNFKEKFTPGRGIIDEAVPDIPVLISRFDFHSGIANSKALEISGIQNKLNEFAPGEITIDEQGNLTGEVKEGALYYIQEFIPVKSIEEKAGILKDEIKRLHAFGITSVSDITLPPDLDVYENILNETGLGLRINSILPYTEFVNLDVYLRRFKIFPESIKFGCFKAFYDGSLSSETAYFHDNYKDRSHNGLRTGFVNSGQFNAIAEEIDKNGFQSAVHAIGDRSVTELLDLVEELNAKHGARDRRFRIEHSQHIKENDLKRFKKLGIIASVQPGHLFSDAKTAIEKIEDVKTTHNYKVLMDEGVVVSFGTDFPIISENPFENIYFAVTRQAEGMDEPFLPEFKIDLDDCIEAYTANNAYASYEESIRGKINPGMLADIAVIDDMYSLPPEEIKNCKAHMTFMEGKRVY